MRRRLVDAALVDDWREAHERFFERPLPDDTPIEAVRFRVIERL